MWTLRGRFNRFVFVRNEFWVLKNETAIAAEVSRQAKLTLGQAVTLLRGTDRLGSGDLSVPHWWGTTS